MGFRRPEMFQILVNCGFVGQRWTVRRLQIRSVLFQCGLRLRTRRTDGFLAFSALGMVWLCSCLVLDRTTLLRVGSLDRDCLVLSLVRTRRDRILFGCFYALPLPGGLVCWLFLWCLCLRLAI